MTTTFVLGGARGGRRAPAGPGKWSPRSPSQRKEPAAASLVASTGAGVARRLPGPSSCSRCRRDRFQGHTLTGSVPGGTDFLIGGIHVRRTGLPCRVCLCVCLLVCLRERVLVCERSIVIVPGRISVGERVFTPLLRACIPLAYCVRIPEPIPVRLPLPIYIRLLVHIGVANANAEHIVVGACVFVRAPIHAVEHTLVRIGIRFYVAA